MGFSGAPGGTRTPSLLIRSYACLTLSCLLCLLCLHSYNFGGKRVYYVHYVHCFYSGCTMVAPLAMRGRRFEPRSERSREQVSIPSNYVYSVYCVQKQRGFVSILSVRSIVSTLFAPKLHPKSSRKGDSFFNLVRYDTGTVRHVGMIAEINSWPCSF